MKDIIFLIFENIFVVIAIFLYLYRLKADMVVR